MKNNITGMEANMEQLLEKVPGLCFTSDNFISVLLFNFLMLFNYSFRLYPCSRRVMGSMHLFFQSEKILRSCIGHEIFSVKSKYLFEAFPLVFFETWSSV